MLHILQDRPAGKVSQIPNRMLMNRLEVVLNKNGFRKGKPGDRFVIVPVVTVTSRDSQPGTPSRITVKLSLRLSAGDGIEGSKFGSVSLPLEGSGNNEITAYVEAYRKLSPDNPEVVHLFNITREKIRAYYSKNCSALIRAANDSAANNNFESGLVQLLSIPDSCKECVSKAKTALADVYKKYIDYQSVHHLSMAKKAWSKDQNNKNAVTACRHLALIDPESSGYADAVSYYQQIADFVKSTGKDFSVEFHPMSPYKDDESLLARERVYQQVLASNKTGVTPSYNLKEW